MNDMARIKEISFIKSYDEIASDDYCGRMIEAYEKIFKNSSLHLQDGEKQYGATKRKDFSLFFDEDRNDTLELATETNRILDKALRLYEADHPSLPMNNYYSRKIKVQKTPPKGGFHTWHPEQGSDEASTRILTWTIYLNDIPEGEGETEFLEYGIKIHPKKGRVCFFPAAWTHTHRGNAVYTHDKYIATGWYYLAQ
jgi:hypothetical protein